MKSMMPWFCLAAVANASSVFASEGLDAYRQGNYNEAASLLADPSSKDPIVAYYMGRMRIYGYGQLKNNTLAIRHFKQAASVGYLPAEDIMARYTLLEENNPSEALTWFKKAADANDVSAQMYCASAYLFGVGVNKNPDLAKRYYILAARNGNAIAQYTLAASFLETHQSANKKLGLIWLNKSLLQGNPEAQLMMAELYASGTLVNKDMIKAKELVTASIASGYKPAVYQMGQIALLDGNVTEARDWFVKAAEAHSVVADIALSKLYGDPKSSLYDLHTSFLWMLKGAQNGSNEAALLLSELYKKGIGTEADENLAKEWQFKAGVYAKASSTKGSEQAAMWLTNGEKTTLAETNYRLQGIFSAWKNPGVLKENNYNQSPQLESVTRERLYKPQFVLMSPNQIPISEYYDTLVASLNNATQKDPLVFPRYVVNDRPFQKTTAVIAENPALSNGEDYDYLQHLVQKNASGGVDYQAVFKKLEGRAVLGDSTAQFDVAQMYQYGLGIPKNAEEAIRYYRLAAAQQELPAEYNLGLMYLQGDGITANHQLGLDWLNDAAFKGNPYAQYALARIYEQGFSDVTGQQVIAPDHEQAVAMYNLASANNYGLAQFRLAELMARETQTDKTRAGKYKRSQLIKSLYQGAVSDGVMAATLPLAFYNAMDASHEKQVLALDAAKKAMDAGNGQAALLLGLMYDRGIAVEKNQKEALSYYQKASVNPVSAFVLGTYLTNGDGISKDVAKGRVLLQQSADAGFSYADLNLAILKQQMGEPFLPELDKAFLSNNSTAGLLLADYYLSLAKDNEQMKKARDIYQHLAEQGDKEAQLKLAFLFDNGLGGPVDIKSAEKWYQLSAVQKQPIAQYLLARLYQLGKLDNAPNYADAKKWYAAAQTAYPPAAVALGFIYDTVDDDYQHAQASYQRAAVGGSPIGQFDLGLIYEKGKGEPVDFVKARALYQQAAAQGQAQAMVQLAGLYLNGQGGERDEQQAMTWYKKAADKGDRDALYQLGVLSETGLAMKLNYPEALQYYQQAADKGNAKATLALARMYRYGLGVPKNEAEATKLYNTLSKQELLPSEPVLSDVGAQKTALKGS